MRVGAPPAAGLPPADDVRRIAARGCSSVATDIALWWWPRPIECNFQAGPLGGRPAGVTPGGTGWVRNHQAYFGCTPCALSGGFCAAGVLIGLGNTAAGFAILAALFMQLVVLRGSFA